MMSTRNVAVLAIGAVLMAALGASADSMTMRSTRVENLTFSRAVALPGVTLTAGTYAFESGPAGSHPSLVRVTTRDGRRVVYTGFTIPLGRPLGTRISPVVFGEAIAGAPTPILMWYPTGSSRGHEFLYRR